MKVNLFCIGFVGNDFFENIKVIFAFFGKNRFRTFDYLFFCILKLPSPKTAVFLSTNFYLPPFKQQKNDIFLIVCVHTILRHSAIF